MDQPVEKIKNVFSQNRTAFMPYFTLGYPDYETSIAIVQGCVEAGADLMELGIPFSDPLADGPTIQHSTQIALENGMTTDACLKAVQELRARGTEIPLMLMGYYNPIMAYGVERFVENVRSVGGSGFIIPDLPPEEAEEFESLCSQKSMGLSYLLSSNSTEERIQLLSQRSRGFTYLVSVIGVTGARDELSSHLRNFVNRVRLVAPPDMPLVVGFGISTPAHVRAVSQFADGIIIGSALINAVDQSRCPVKAASNYVRKIREVLD